MSKPDKPDEVERMRLATQLLVDELTRCVQAVEAWSGVMFPGEEPREPPRRKPSVENREEVPSSSATNKISSKGPRPGKWRDGKRFLTSEEADEIRRLIARSGVMQRTVAKRIGVTAARMSGILNRRLRVGPEELTRIKNATRLGDLPAQL